MLHTGMTIDEKLREYANWHSERRRDIVCRFEGIANFDAKLWLHEHEYLYLHDVLTIECLSRTSTYNELIEVYIMHGKPSIDGTTILGPDTSKEVKIKLTLLTLGIDDKTVANSVVNAIRSNFKLTKALRCKLKKFFESRSLLKAQ